MIHYHGSIKIPAETVEYADTIKLENYKTNVPKEFQIRCLAGCDQLMADLAALIGLDRSSLDFVYFSCCQGAEPHVDRLPRFKSITYVIPVVLPQGRSVIEADGVQMVVALGGVYAFDHTKTHAMYLQDTTSGCVVIMVGVKKERPL